MQPKVTPVQTDYATVHDSDERLEVLCVDMAGVPRGKWVPASQSDKVLDGQVRLPLSTQSLDIWGEDNDDLTGLSESIGDPTEFAMPINAPWFRCLGLMDSKFSRPFNQWMARLALWIPVPFLLM